MNESGVSESVSVKYEECTNHLGYSRTTEQTVELYLFVSFVDQYYCIQRAALEDCSIQINVHISI